MPLQKPFLKWVGGKTQLLEPITEMLPTEMESYHEPFLGGGSVLLAVLSLAREGHIQIRGDIYASDANRSLVDVYKHIQTAKEELYDEIQRILAVYDSLRGTEVNRAPTTHLEATTSKESYYYWLRTQFNAEPEGTIRKSALFMFLNKTGFRGIYREGPNGFNVPYGHYKKTPVVLARADLDAVHDLIQEVVFVHCDFVDSLAAVEAGDFVYLDPPYAPETPSSFVGYTSAGFTLEQHEALFKLVSLLKEKGVGFVMSNADVEMVTCAFQGYDCVKVSARRAIHSKKPETTTTEVLIRSQLAAAD